MLCPTFCTQGFCENEACPHIHPNFMCDICGVMCRNQEYYNHHLASARHAAATKKGNAPKSGRIPHKCIICNVNLDTPGSVNDHLKGKVHTVRLLALRQQGTAVDTGQIIVEDKERLFECEICKTTIWNQDKAKHELSSRHKRQERFVSVKAALQEAEKDKYGVSITPSGNDAFDFGIMETGKSSRNFYVSIDNGKTGIFLRSAKVTSLTQQPCFSVNIGTGVFLKVSRGTVIFDSQGNKGQFQDRLEMIFFDYNTKRRFAICKPLSAIVGNREDWELLKPIAPYVPIKVGQQEPVEELIPGRPPEAIAPVEWFTKLGKYKLKQPLKTILEMPKMADKIRLIKAGYMPRQLTAQTHKNWFHVLLHLEEYQSEIDLERYTQENVTLEQVGMLYFLDVPGLAEKRPSVIVGDRILVREHGETKRKWWEGFVHKVQLKKVGCGFDDEFKPLKRQKFDVRFCLGRLPLRRMHQALDAGPVQARILFPREEHTKNIRPLDSTVKALVPFDRGVGSNPPQMLAVAAIRNLLPGSPPFIVFGPPGTGKTVTIIEAIRQILHTDPKARILACAPSNSAADIIAQRLSVLGESQLFRLNAPSRPQKLLPRELESFSRKNSQDGFAVPEKTQLMRFRVIVSTCISAAVPYALGFPSGHFSHVFVDEAGQACEPEVLIGIKTVANGSTNLILSGDPKQLGPIVRSNVALKFQYGISLLDRLISLPLYDQSTMQGITIVNLSRNFRSHRTILEFPNQRFYRGLLESRADPAIANAMLRTEFLVKPGFQVMFHSILGKDMREAYSPSFFNPIEASQVKEYVRMLKQDQRLRLKDEHIGVIAPYNAQCGKIRQLLEKIKAKDVKVGSVEEFQGQERRVVIISTVRGDTEFVQTDILHTLGFLANPRRFNVAMTRAQALLIVIGNPLVLSLDGLWRSFLNYVFNHGGWTGLPRPDWDTNTEIDGAALVQLRAAKVSAEEEDLLKRITETVEKVNADEELEDLGDGYQQVERPWREGE